MSCILDCLTSWCNKGNTVVPPPAHQSVSPARTTRSQSPLSPLSPLSPVSPTTSPNATTRRHMAREDYNEAACRVHEMRNALYGVQGGIQILAEKKLDPEIASVVRETAQSCDYLQHIAQDFLDFNKTGEIRYVLHEKAFALVDLRALILRSTQTKAIEKGLELSVEMGSNVPMNITGDQFRLAQILINFVTNAIKFTAKGSVTVRITLEGEDQAKESLRFAVSDTGKGIPADEMGKLFAPYAQASSDRNQGTGLGLFICKQLAELMNPELRQGKRCIGVESAMDQGSVFWFTIPCKRIEETLAAPVLVLPPLPQPKFEALRVLVAEDNDINKKIMARMLVQLGCTKANIVLVSDGNEAVQAYKSGQFNAVFMDIIMPNCGGHDAAKQIRAFETASAKKPVPIVACTGNERERYEGMDHVLVKPIVSDSLLKILSGLV